MSYIYARGYGKSLTDESFEVRIVHNDTGTDSTREFALDPVGFKLSYESPDDTLLVPGIVHSRCEVTTFWQSAQFSALDTLLSDMASGQDGDYILHVLQDSDTLWAGTILIEQMSVSEDSALRSVSMVASDGLSMLRNVSYNNSGTKYTGYQTVLQMFQNIQDKWVVFDFLTDIAINSDRRLSFIDDVYNEDDLLLALLPHPAGTIYNTLDRCRIHTNPWSKVNEAGDTEYINCYDLLESLCTTYQFRLFYYEMGWFMIPCALSAQSASGYAMTYQGVITSPENFLNSWSYQIEGADTRQKGNDWVQTFTPQTKEISLTRDPNDGATILSATNTANDTELTAADLVYPGIDTESEDVRYILEGQVIVGNSAITIDENDDLGRLQLRFIIEWSPDATSEYYVNTLASVYDGQVAAAQMFDGINVNYAMMIAYSPEYSATSGYYNLGQTEDHFYTPSQAGSRVINFRVAIPPPQTAKTGLKITPKVEAYNPTAQSDSTLQDALTINWFYLNVQKWSGDELELIQNFDYVASSTLGQNKAHLGTTYVGGLGASMGNIEVETAVDVWNRSQNWVSQAQGVARPINELCVEEILAMHTRAHKIEKGSLVLRGTATMPKPFSRYFDNDTGIYYAALNYEMQATPSELGVTLRSIGRNAISITTDYENTGRLPNVPSTDISQGTVKPDHQVMYSYNNQARNNFLLDYSSVIGGGETKEMYWSLTNDGQGRYIDAQGDTPAPGNVIARKVYVQTRGLQTPSDSGWLTPSGVQPATDDTLLDTIDLIREYMSKIGDHGSYTFMITYQETSSFTGILDTYTTASAAYSTRRLSSTYTGSLLRVRRADGTELDIEFDVDGNLDESAISTFAGGTACTVATWYDQSGNGNDLTNTTVSTQPEIYTGSVFYSIGGGTPARKALNFNSDYLYNTADLHAGAFYATAAVVTGASIGNLHILNQDDSLAGGTARIGQYLRTGSTNNTARSVVFNTAGTSTADNTANNTVTTNTAYVISAHGKSNQIEAFVDDTSNGHTSLTGPLRHGSGLYRVGASAHTTTPASFWNGRIAELIFFDEDMSGGHQTGVVSNIQTYFTI